MDGSTHKCRMRVLAVEGGRKKLKLAVEGATVGSAIEGGFSSPGSDNIDVVGDILSDLVSTLMATKNRTLSKDFRPKMGLRNEKKRRM